MRREHQRKQQIRRANPFRIGIKTHPRQRIQKDAIAERYGFELLAHRPNLPSILVNDTGRDGLAQCDKPDLIQVSPCHRRARIKQQYVAFLCRTFCGLSRGKIVGTVNRGLKVDRFRDKGRRLIAATTLFDEVVHE